MVCTYAPTLRGCSLDRRWRLRGVRRRRLAGSRCRLSWTLLSAMRWRLRCSSWPASRCCLRLAAKLKQYGAVVALCEQQKKGVCAGCPAARLAALKPDYKPCCRTYGHSRGSMLSLTSQSKLYQAHWHTRLITQHIASTWGSCQGPQNAAPSWLTSAMSPTPSNARRRVLCLLTEAKGMLWQRCGRPTPCRTGTVLTVRAPNDTLSECIPTREYMRLSISHLLQRFKSGCTGWVDCCSNLSLGLDLAGHPLDYTPQMWRD